MQLDNNIKFGELLSKMIKAAGITQTSFYTQLKITKPYFYDILSGKAKPPPAEKQLMIVKILNPDIETQKEFFESAACAREEPPADIWQYFIQHKELRDAIRRAKEKDIPDKEWKKLYIGGAK